jgi:hypothetical protein
LIAAVVALALATALAVMMVIATTPQRPVLNSEMSNSPHGCLQEFLSFSVPSTNSAKKLAANLER